MLARVHAEAVRLELARAIVDLRRLESMSSSCLRCFLAWIAEIQELSADRRYKVMLLVDPARRWQRRSLGALRRFAVELVSSPEAPGVT